MGLFSFIGEILGLGGGASRKIEVSKASAASGLQIVYGQRRVVPVPVYKIASRYEMKINSPGAYDHYEKASSTDGEKSDGSRDNNDWLHRVDVWGQGPIEGIERFWLDGDISTGGRFKKRAYFRMASKFGSENQTVAQELATGPSTWSNTQVGTGVAYTWGRFYNSRKKPEFNAEPELNALIKGLRIYDPRKDDTEGGVGLQRFGDPVTWTYSNNRALVLLNYMMGSFGFNAAREDIDLPSFMAAADACEVTFDIPAPIANTTGAPIPDVYSGTVGDFRTIEDSEAFDRWAADEVQRIEGGLPVWSHPKHVTNAVLDPKTGVVINTKKLLEGMGWALPWSNGKHKLIIEGPVTGPVMTFDEDSILGDWTIERGMRSERLNRVTVEFPNGTKDYEKDTVGWPALVSTEYGDYLAEDNAQELHTNVPVETITNFYAAQAYAEYLVRKSRVAIKITGLKLAPSAMLLEPGDVIALTFPEKNFSNTQFIVEKVNTSAFLDVSVDLVLYDPTVYGAPALEQEPVAGSPYSSEIWQDPAPVVNLQLAALYDTNADGSVISNLRVSWDDPLQAVGITSYEVRWRKTADAAFENALTLSGTSLSAVIPGLVNDTDYTVEVDYTTRKGKTADAAVQAITLAAVASKLDSIEDGATRTFPRGEYDDFATYSFGDVVSYQGSSYIFAASTAVVGEEPGTGPSWALLASVGATGPQGVAGAIGADGTTTYTWIRYADDALGTGISNSPTGKAYIGFAYNKATIAESNIPADYAWSLVQGADGNTGVAGPAGADGTTTYTWIKYSANVDGTGLTDLPQANTAYIGIATNKTTASESAIKTDYIWSQWLGPTGNTGATGITGAAGTNGTHGYTINASVPAFTIQATFGGTVLSGEFPATSQIKLYQGTTDRTSAASYTRTAVGCNASVSSGGLVTINSMTADSAYVDITATHSTVSLTTRIVVVKAKAGSSATAKTATISSTNSSTYVTVAGPITLNLGAGGTVELDASIVYTSTPEGKTLTGKFEYLPDGETIWTAVGTSQTGYGEEFPFPGSLNIARSLSGPASAEDWQFRLRVKNTTGSGTIVNTTATKKFTASWVG